METCTLGTVEGKTRKGLPIPTKSLEIRLEPCECESLMHGSQGRGGEQSPNLTRQTRR